MAVVMVYMVSFLWSLSAVAAALGASRMESSDSYMFGNDWVGLMSGGSRGRGRAVWVLVATGPAESRRRSGGE